MAKEASKANNDKRNDQSPPMEQGEPRQQAQPSSKRPGGSPQQSDKTAGDERGRSRTAGQSSQTGVPRYDDRPEAASVSGEGKRGRDPSTTPDLPRYDDRPGDETRSASPRSPNYGDDEPGDPRKLETEARSNRRSARSIETRDQSQSPE